MMLRYMVSRFGVYAKLLIVMILLTKSNVHRNGVLH